jgi:anti-sigma-K factor RskA
MVGEAEPSPDVWDKIKARIAPAKEGAEITPQDPKPEGADASPPTPVLAPVTASAPTPAGDPASEGDNVVDLTRQFRQWRGAAIATGALAASLAAFALALELVPDLLPQALRPRIDTAGSQSPAARFVAVLQRDASSPAFLLTVDIEQRSLTVRRVAAEREPGKSYELWLVAERFPQPRSLGVVGADEFTTARTLASYDANTISDATYAVSLEPEGGSPTGFPTGPVLWLGKLLEATPPPR